MAVLEAANLTSVVTTVEKVWTLINLPTMPKLGLQIYFLKFANERQIKVVLFIPKVIRRRRHGIGREARIVPSRSNWTMWKYRE